MREVGIEKASVLGLAPVAFVNLTADLGCEYISASLTSPGNAPLGYAPFSLRDDVALRREMIAAMRDRGVSISLGEGLIVWPDKDVADLAEDLDLMGELGVKRINTVSFEPDLGRTFDQFAALAEMAGARGMVTTTEFAPCLVVQDLPTALAAVRHVGRDDFRLLIDTMHVIRSGSTAADIAALDPDLIGYVQWCDAPLAPRIPDYMEEAMFERLAPGDGELGLADLVRVLPRDGVYGLEVPLRSDAEAGVGPYERVGKIVETARAFLARLD